MQLDETTCNRRPGLIWKNALQWVGSGVHTCIYQHHDKQVAKIKQVTYHTRRERWLQLPAPPYMKPCTVTCNEYSFIYICKQFILSCDELVMLRTLMPVQHQGWQRQLEPPYFFTNKVILISLVARAISIYIMIYKQSRQLANARFTFCWNGSGSYCSTSTHHMLTSSSCLDHVNSELICSQHNYSKTKP